MIYYVSNADIPGKKAHTIQQLRMCNSFANVGANVCLVHPSHGDRAKSLAWDDINDYYGLRTRFQIRTIHSLQGRFDRLPQIGLASMVGAMTGWLIRRTLRGAIDASAIIYGRNYYGLFLYSQLVRSLPESRRPTVIYEHHDTISAHQKQRFFNAIDGVVCITHALAEYDRTTYGIKQSRCLVAPDGVNLEPYQTMNQVDARKQLEIDPAEPIVMYTGHLYPPKGVETLLEAARDIDGTVYVVGGYSDDIERLRRDAPTPENVEFTGFVEPATIPIYQRAADVLVAPYRTDAREYLSPLKLFEYMAAERPIVASDLDVLREVLRDGENALLVPPQEPDSLAACITRLLNDHEVARRLTERARTDVEAYTWDQRAKNILEFASGL